MEGAEGDGKRTRGKTICQVIYRDESHAESRKSVAPRDFLRRCKKGL